MDNLSIEEMEKLAREEKNRYQREWRAANKDKVRKNNLKYWAKKALERQK